MKPLILAAVLSGAALGTAQAAKKVSTSRAYDGTWSIEVITTAGSCDRAYRYGVRIENGEARYPGSDFTITGRVAGSGSVRATISRGSSSAHVVGRLGREGFGNGTWNADGGCSGNWNAERRS